MKKAWQDPVGVIRDIAQGDPVKSYHPDVAAFYTTDVPDDSVNGATLIDGVWTNPPPPTPPTEAEMAAQEVARLVVMTAETAVVVRATRTFLLTATDWRAVSDLVLSTEWATYRQALRDVTSQATFPSEVIWPTKPE